MKFWEEKKRHNRCPWTVFHWNCWRKWENKKKWEINKLLNFNFSNIYLKKKRKKRKGTNGNRGNEYWIFFFLAIISYFNDFIPSFRFVVSIGLEISKLTLFFVLYFIVFKSLYFPFFLFFHYFIMRLGAKAEIQFHRVKKHSESMEAQKNTKITITESNKQNIVLGEE